MGISFDPKQLVLILKDISKYLIDIGRFIFQPKEYFKIVLEEKPIYNVKRLFIYAISSDILVFCLFYSVTNSSGELEPFKLSIKLFGIVLLEMLWALLLVSSLFLTGQLCKPKIGLRISIVYSLTFRFVYFLIPIIFYTFFILTENYVFAILKGVIYFVILIGFFLFYPFLFSVGLKRRLLTVSVSLFSFLLIIFFLGNVLSYFPHSFEKIKKLSINYDPIASEINKTLWNYTFPPIKIEEFERFSEIIKESIIRGKDQRKGYVSIPLNDIKSGAKQFEIEWNTKGKSYKEELENQLQQVERHLKSVKYSTTKEFLNLKEDEIRSYLILISKLDELPKQFNSDPSKGLNLFIYDVKLQTEYLKKRITFMTKMNDYQRFLIVFSKYYIIIY